ncbi:D-glycero-alpha-D-manno-heptose-1,7-bisphosphate 7-phosphatase [Humisphaera borealis]|uniref:D,D-heptose 1,7-bisphosphate phosphatase n=1 Tax=Humisphaera borealis TaxID=2807512 RepID=A0A7M2WY23_9BACT|nr:HAD family hydrolase [Humisphaera borealis]QOV90254.1 HAD-IIIA family hydrolase [Humisphaera borealis]
MNRPAVFFDRDNTLIACDGYLGDPDKVVLVDGAADAVARVRELGFAAVVFSNQSGVARGMFPEEAVHAVNHRLDDLLHEENPRATIDRHDFCPYHPTAKVDRYRVDSELRKPKPGMIYQAAAVLNLDLPRSWVIGDAPRDIAAGQTAGLRTVLLKIASLPPSPATNEGSEASPDFVAGSLKEAVDFIARNLGQPAASQPSATAGTAANATTAAAAGTASAAARAGVPSPTTLAAGSTAGDAWTSSGSGGSSAAAARVTSSPAAATTSSTTPTAARSADVRAEEPVKLTPRPKPSEPIKPAAAKPEPSKPEAGKPETPKQGGFVVKPSQPMPAGMSWGERMRLAKSGTSLTSAVSAARPDIPRSSATASPPAPVTTAVAPAAPIEDPVVDEVEPPVEQEPSRPSYAPTPAYTPAHTPTPAPTPTPDPVVAESAAGESDPEPVASTPAIAPEQPVAEVPARSEPAAPVEPPASAEPEPTARAEPAPTEPAEVTPQASASSNDSAALSASPPKRGLRREDLMEPTETGDVSDPTADAAERRRPRDAGDSSRTEVLLEQILAELRRRDDLVSTDFSASKLFAGITQVLALAALFYSYFNKDTSAFQSTVVLAIALQTLTISLLIMGKQK